MNTTYPPGPKTNFFGVNYLQPLIWNPVTLIDQLISTYGDLVHLHVFNSHIYVINDHKLIHQLLNENEHEGQIERSGIEKKVLGELYRDGLIFSEGELWERERRFLQPAYHYRQILNHFPALIQSISHLLAQWQQQPSRSLQIDFWKLSLAANITIYFGRLSSEQAQGIAQACTEAKWLRPRLEVEAIFFPSWMATRTRKRFKEVTKNLDHILMQLIKEHRSNPGLSTTLVSQFIQTPYNDGEFISDRQLRDEIINLFMGGLTTTTQALISTLYLLATHPEVKAKLYSEVDSVVGDREPTLNDLSHLPFTDMIIKETLRLYPPLSPIIRQPIEPFHLKDYEVRPPNSYLLISPNRLHRDPRCYDVPESFIPERFSPTQQQKIPHYAYIPFGAGPRVCIGQHLVTLIIKLTLVLICQQFDFKIAPNSENMRPSRLQAPTTLNLVSSLRVKREGAYEIMR